MLRLVCCCSVWYRLWGLGPHSVMCGCKKRMRTTLSASQRGYLHSIGGTLNNKCVATCIKPTAFPPRSHKGLSRRGKLSFVGEPGLRRRTLACYGSIKGGLGVGVRFLDLGFMGSWGGA